MFADEAAEVRPAGRGRLGSLPAYGVAVGVTVLAILSQYFVPETVPAFRPLYATLLGGIVVTYGVPILAFAVLVGLRPLDRFAHQMGRSLPPALAWYGALSLLSIGVLIGLAALYYALDPSALDLLQKPNPVLQAAASDPWFWVAFSFAVGALEEAIFRGWIFGYWIARGSANLGWHAVWTSALFASVHLYYGVTYLAAAPFSYSSLFLLGLAFSLAVRASRGNLVWVALLHGGTDAAAFLTIVSPEWAAAAHYGLVLGGGLVALLLYLYSRPAPLPPPPFYLAPPPTGSGPYVWAPGSAWAPPALPVVPPPPPPPPTPEPPPGAPP